MVLARSLISKSSSPFFKALDIVPSAPFTIVILVTFMLYSLFSSLARFKCLSLFSFSLIFTSWSTGTVKSTIRQILIFFLSFFLTITTSGLLIGNGKSIYIEKSYRILCVYLSRTDSKLCIYHLVEWSNFNFLHNSQWILCHSRV